MVQIVGRNPEAVKKITCHSCASVLEYTKGEIQERHGTDYSGGADGCQFIVCPGCGKNVIIRSW